MTKIALTLALFGLLTPNVFSQSLSLKEKQALAELDFSWAEKRILDNYGSQVDILLDMESTAGDLDAILYADSRGAQVAANTIARICGNEIGKEALRDKKIKKVVIINSPDGKPRTVHIKDGVMTIVAGLSSRDNYFSEIELREAVESIL